MMIKTITCYKIRDILEEINTFGFSPAFLIKRKIWWIKKLVYHYWYPYVILWSITIFLQMALVHRNKNFGRPCDRQIWMQKVFVILNEGWNDSCWEIRPTSASAEEVLVCLGVDLGWRSWREITRSTILQFLGC